MCGCYVAWMKSLFSIKTWYLLKGKPILADTLNGCLFYGGLFLSKLFSDIYCANCICILSTLLHLWQNTFWQAGCAWWCQCLFNVEGRPIPHCGVWWWHNNVGFCVRGKKGECWMMYNIETDGKKSFKPIEEKVEWILLVVLWCGDHRKSVIFSDSKIIADESQVKCFSTPRWASEVTRNYYY